MFDTLVTIVGNALTTPEWRRIQSNQSLVANFKVAANSRRYDKASGRWVDGASLRVRVSCWRRLAENVTASVITGDPVIVTGRLYSRDWVTEDGQHRVSYELDAVAVGHDLARGRGKFTRQRATGSTSAVDDEAAEKRVGGEASAPVPQLNDRQRSQVYDEDLGGYVTAVESDSVVQMMADAGLSADRVDVDDTDQYRDVPFGAEPYGRPEQFAAADFGPGTASRTTVRGLDDGNRSAGEQSAGAQSAGDETTADETTVGDSAGDDSAADPDTDGGGGESGGTTDSGRRRRRARMSVPV